MEAATIVIALFLVQGGQPEAVVVTPESPTEQVQWAAEEFVRHVELMSGARLLVKPETALTEEEKQRGIVAIGATQLARDAGIRVEDLPPEGYRIKAQSKRLFLLGREDKGPGKAEQQGASYAVTAFLEEELGVRWLWPGALGTIAPRSDTISVPELDRSYQPPLPQRRIRNAITNIKFKDGLNRVPMAPERYSAMCAESEAWMKRMRLGSRVQIAAGHAFTSWYEQYHKEHPDYFALHLNGSREWGGRGLGAPKNVKLCVSNPAVLEQWIANVKAALAANPTLQCFSASPNDGYYTGHCTCDKCRAWDVPDAPDRYTFFDVNKDGPTSYEYVSLTDRYLKFYNLCAEELAKIAPDKFVGGYAYGTWRAVPLRERVHENVIIGFVGLNYFDEKLRQDDLRYWNGWCKLAKRLYLRPNLLHGGDAFPGIYVHKLAEDFRHCFDTGMMATDFDSLVHHWATQGLNYYVLAKLLWDPHADVEAIADQYCTAGFGQAAPKVKEYFVELEKLTDKIASEYTDASEVVEDEQKKAVSVRFWNLAPQWYTPPVLEALSARLEQAKQAAGGNAEVMARIEFLREGLRYADLRSRALRLREEEAKLGPDAADRRTKVQEMNGAFDDLKAYYTRNAATWVIAPQLVRMISAEMPAREGK